MKHSLWILFIYIPWSFAARFSLLSSQIFLSRVQTYAIPPPQTLQKDNVADQGQLLLHCSANLAKNGYISQLEQVLGGTTMFFKDGSPSGNHGILAKHHLCVPDPSLPLLRIARVLQ
jgi:hypothetical protein